MPVSRAPANKSLRFSLIALGVFASATFLWLSFRNTDIAEIRTTLASANPYWVVPFLLLLFGFYWLKSRRWRDLLSPTRSLRSADLFPAVMIGYAGTAVLPMQMGELVRAFVVSRKQSMSYALVLGSIGIERVFDFLSVLAILGVVLVAGENIPQAMRMAGYVVATGCLIALTLTTLLVTQTEMILRFIRTAFGWLPKRFVQKTLEQMRQISMGFQVLRHPQVLIAVAVNSLVQWLLMGGCILFSLWAFDIDVPPTAAAMVLVATIIGVSLPTSPGYVGNIQLAFALALLPYGVSRESAIAASIYYHILAYVSVVVTGFIFLHRYGYQLGKLRREATDSLEQ